MMKKALLVLGLAMCTTFAFAQTNNVSISKSKQDAALAKKAPNAALVDYKASIFAKAGDTLVTWEFDQAMASSVNAGTIGQNDRIDDTLVGNNAHGQNATYAIWQRIPDSAYIFSDNFANTYADMATYTGLMNALAIRVSALNAGNDNGFMFICANEAPDRSGVFNSYFTLPTVQNMANAGVIDIAFIQAHIKYYDQCFIDYKVGNSWKSREINVTGVDVEVNSWGPYRATYVMPLVLAQQPNIEVRFRFFCDGQNGNSYGYYWMVDNVKVIAYPTPTNRWVNHGEKYIDGAYGTIPEGMTIPLTWASSLTNTGTGVLNNVNVQMSHLYFDNEELQTEVFLTTPQDPIATEATNTVKVDERGFYDADYSGWLGFSENYGAEHIGSPYTLRGMPTTNPGYNYVTATATCGDITSEWDTILYRVSQMEEVEPGMIEGYRWAHDNGLIPSNSVWSLQLTDPDALGRQFVTEGTDVLHYVQSGYSLTVRYTTGNDIPEGWVFRGLEFITATTSDIMDNIDQTQFIPLAYTEEYSEDGERVGWNAINTGVSNAIVEVSENDANTLVTGYILPNQSYRAVNVLFPEQPELLPNTAYRFGYRLNRDGYFAVATTAWSYRNEQGTNTAYYNDANVAPFYNQFAAGSPYDVYVNDPSREGGFWGSYHTDVYPMIRPIVGPAMEVPRTKVYPQCEGDTNYYIEYLDDDVCGADVSVAEGSSPVFYVVPDGHMIIDKIIVDGQEIEPWDEEEGTGDENCWLGEYPILDDDNGDTLYMRYWWAYMYDNIVNNPNQPHTISAVCHWHNVGIDPVAPNVSLGLSPNPATSQVSMNIKGVTGMVNCNIIDMSGRVIYNANINAEQTHTINLSNIPAGAYFVRVTNNEFSKVEKLIVR